MEHLNYCRQMVKQFADAAAIPSKPAWQKEILSHAIDLAKASQKFLLPDGGRLLHDPDYKAIDESQPLRLPFPMIALEYQRSRDVSDPGRYFPTSKAIVFARERDDGIAVLPIAWFDQHGIWAPLPEVLLPLYGYLDRSKVVDGLPSIAFIPTDQRVAASDYGQELRVLLGFVNILGCANVRIERSDPRRAAKKVKAALPFDSYHILTLDSGGQQTKAGVSGEHRSPREHLRRGHIRRLDDGRRIWVNACLVGAGRGAGVVTKDYAVGGGSLRPRAHTRVGGS